MRQSPAKHFSSDNEGNLKISIKLSVLWVHRLSIDIDTAAIIMMEFLGIVSFLVAFLFYRQRQRVRNKQKEYLDAISRQVISERGDGKCFSSEWALDKIVYKPKTILHATPLMMGAVVLLIAVVVMGAGTHVLLNFIKLGYVSIIALLGASVLLYTDAFQAYSFTNAIGKVATDQLDREDESYLKLAQEALEEATLRFVSLGVAFAVFGPVTPQIFSGLVYGIALYANIYFQATEVTFRYLIFLGAIIVMILPAIMLFLPELVGRILIRKGKSLVRALHKRGIEK